MIFTTENGTFGTCSEGTNYKVKHTNKIEFCPIKHATVQFVSPISCSMTVLLRVSWIMKQKVFIPQNRLFHTVPFYGSRLKMRMVGSALSQECKSSCVPLMTNGGWDSLLLWTEWYCYTQTHSPLSTVVSFP